MRKGGDNDISQELGLVGVPLLDGGRFRRMADIVLASLVRDSEERSEPAVSSKTPETRGCRPAGLQRCTSASAYVCVDVVLT